MKRLEQEIINRLKAEQEKLDKLEQKHKSNSTLQIEQNLTGNVTGYETGNNTGNKTENETGNQETFGENSAIQSQIQDFLQKEKFEQEIISKLKLQQEVIVELELLLDSINELIRNQTTLNISIKPEEFNKVEENELLDVYITSFLKTFPLRQAILFSKLEKENIKEKYFEEELINQLTAYLAQVLDRQLGGNKTTYKHEILVDEIAFEKNILEKLNLEQEMIDKIALEQEAIDQLIMDQELIDKQMIDQG